MPIDQDAWNLVQTHLDSDPKGQVDGFAALRSANIVAWERIPTTAMERTGYHTGADIEISLRTLMCIQAGHDRRHLEQLERVIAAAGTGT